jgi:formate dehydrogenase major subunit
MESNAYINNIPYQIIPGETIYDFVSRYKGKEFIPVICQDDKLENYGACRICSVEISREKGGDSRVVASCHTPVQEGIYITTHSKRIEKLRKNILELVLSNYPKSAIKPKKGHKPTPFQKLLTDLNVNSTRYNNGQTHAAIVEDLSHPYIHSDLKECIHCYKCVRVCDEVQGELVLGIADRGFNSRIVKDDDTTFKESTCVSCGACVQICPTNALKDRYLSKTVEADKEIRTVCTYCGVGCNLNVKVKNDKVIAIQGVPDAEANMGHTCLKGRFAFEFYKHPDRLQKPLIKKRGKFVESTWQEAYDLIESKFKAIIEKSGSDAVAGISSSRCTNEENYLMQKFFRVVAGTNNIDGCARVCHAPTAWGMQQAYGTGAATNSIEDLKECDLILLVGSNSTEAHPVTGAKIKQQIMKGKTLIVIDPIKIKLAKYAKYHLQLRPGTNVPMMLMFARFILDEGLIDEEFIKKNTVGFNKFIEKLKAFDVDEAEQITGVDKELVRKAAIEYATAGNAMEFHGLGVTEHYQGSKTVMLLANIAMMTGNIGRPGVGLNPLRGQNNVQGAADMGVQPHQGAGYLDVTKEESIDHYFKVYNKRLPDKIGLKIPEMFHASREGKLKGMWIMGEDILQTDPNTCEVDKALGSLEFLVVQEIFMTDTARKADVILPASSFFEKEGTFTSSERRVQRVQKVVEPLNGTKPDGQIVVDIMRRFGYEQCDYTAADMLDEINKVVPFFEGITWERLGDNGLQWPVKKDGTDTKILHIDGKFKRGKGKFHYFDYIESPETVEHKDKYPFVLTTGRLLEHYNCGTMTRRTPNSVLITEDLLKINPADAERKGIKHHDFVKVSSPRGFVIMRADITDELKPGILYTTFHFPEISINHITSGLGDIDTLTPEYKVVAIDIERVEESDVKERYACYEL